MSADGISETLVGFATSSEHLIAEIICPTVLADQCHDLETNKKLYKINCAALSAHLEMIGKMMSLFPGVNGNPPLQAVNLMNLYYQMMPVDWQRAFLNSSQVIMDVNYTLLMLQCFITLQEEQTAMDVASHLQDQQHQHPRKAHSKNARCLPTPHQCASLQAGPSPQCQHMVQEAFPAQ